MELGPIQKTVAIQCELDRKIQTSNDISTWRTMRRTSRKQQIWLLLVNFVHVCGKFQTVSKPNMLLLFSKKAKWTTASWNCRFIGQILDTETRQKPNDWIYTDGKFERAYHIKGLKSRIYRLRPYHDHTTSSLEYTRSSVCRSSQRSRPISSDLGS